MYRLRNQDWKCNINYPATPYCACPQKNILSNLGIKCAAIDPGHGSDGSQKEGHDGMANGREMAVEEMVRVMIEDRRRHEVELTLE